MSEPERFVVAAIEPRPWKNGAGSTSEIALHPRGAGMDQFEWRLSVAEVDHAAPFSAFAGIDRIIVVLAGAGLRLSGDGLSHDLRRPFVPYAFAGERALHGEPIGGATRDLNVMTRRGAWRSELRTLRRAAALPGADAGLLFGAKGRWYEPVLNEGEALLWRDGLPAQHVVPASPDAVLLAVRLTRELPL